MRPQSLVRFFVRIFLFLAGTVVVASAANPCTPTGANNSMTICSPASGATLSSPVQVVAAANSSAAVQFTEIYVDNVKVYQANGNGVNTPITLTPGAHYLVVQRPITELTSRAEKTLPSPAVSRPNGCTASGRRKQHHHLLAGGELDRVLAGTTDCLNELDGCSAVHAGLRRQPEGLSGERRHGEHLAHVDSGQSRLTVQAYNGAFLHPPETITVAGTTTVHALRPAR